LPVWVIYSSALPGGAADTRQAATGIAVVPDVVALAIRACAPPPPATDPGRLLVYVRLLVCIRLLVWGWRSRRGACTQHAHALPVWVIYSSALPGGAADTRQAATGIAVVPDVVALAIRACAPPPPATDPGRLLVYVRLLLVCIGLLVWGRSSWRGACTRHLHAKANGVIYSSARTWSATDARQAAASVAVVADIVALAIRACAPSTPTADAIYPLVPVHVWLARTWSKCLALEECD